MKKFFIGVMVGAILSFAGSAYADEIASLVGKQIQGEFTVKLNGKELANKAAVVDGTSYLPVRAIGEALNMDISFNADMGIELKAKEALNTMEQPIVATDLVNPVQEIPQLQVVKYKIKSESLNIDKGNNEIETILVDGEQYVEARFAAEFVSFKKPTLTINIPDVLESEVTVVDEYSSGAAAFVMDGAVFLKLSTIGLKATVNGDTLVIEKQ